MISICLTYFRSLTLANLDAALFSVRQQDLSRVSELILLDNNTKDRVEEILELVGRHQFPIPTPIYSDKHGNSTRTHPWSTNTVVRQAQSPWVFFTRADYVLEFDAVARMAAEATMNQFVVGNFFDVNADVAQCEETNWRARGPGVLRQYGYECHHAMIDSGVWLTTQENFQKVNGLDESLYAWGHAQTVFQHKLFKIDVPIVQAPGILYYHIKHAAERDMSLAHAQLHQLGLDAKTLWNRFPGQNPYL